jgi:riboflavin biosynthesis pyrimidine reductase
VHKWLNVGQVGPAAAAVIGSVMVEERARALYGGPIGRAEGVLHVVAIAEPGRRVMKIGEHSPKSENDYFALELARARVDAILVSGAVLRAEPSLRYELSPALAAWRRDVLAIERDPWLLVLSRGAVDPAHPALSSAVRPIVFTSAPITMPRSVEVVIDEDASPRAAIAHLRARGARGIGIEAGPRVAVPLYDTPSAIDELALSVFEGALDPRAEGGSFLHQSEIARAGLSRVSAVRIEEASGPWRFERYLRSSK